MNTITKNLKKVDDTHSNKSKNKLSQILLFTLTGFLLSQFVLLNILYSQNPLGGWVTPFGSIATLTLLSFVLLALATCLVALWRSASVKVNLVENHSIPTIFTSASPE